MQRYANVDAAPNHLGPSILGVAAGPYRQRRLILVFTILGTRSAIAVRTTT
jgi:hypothetical protein